MQVISLSSKWNLCPKSWQNFIRHLQYVAWEEVSIRTIRKELKPYGGICRTVRDRGSDTTYALEFENDEDYMMFILSWS